MPTVFMFRERRSYREERRKPAPKFHNNLRQKLNTGRIKGFRK